MRDPAWRFILRYALAWTIIMVPLTLIFDSFNGDRFSAKEVGFRIFFQALGGLVYGSWFRWFVKRRVKKIEKKLSGI